MTDERARTRKVTFPGGSAEVRKARRDHWCSARDAYPYPCPGRIPAGEEYVRSVMFPSHDASGYDVPVVRDTCRDCAPNYLYLDQLDVAFPPGSSSGGDQS